MIGEHLYTRDGSGYLGIALHVSYDPLLGHIIMYANPETGKIMEMAAILTMIGPEPDDE